MAASADGSGRLRPRAVLSDESAPTTTEGETPNKFDLKVTELIKPPFKRSVMLSRQRIAGIVLALLVLSSGCIGFITGSEAQTFEADWAKTDDSVASDAGYDLNATNTQTVEREFSAGGQSRTVEVINRIATYEKEMSVGPLGQKVGVFAVVSSPAVEIGPKTFNPLADYSNEKLVQLLASNYESIDDVRKVDARNVTVLGTETEMTKFAAKAKFAGTNLDVYIHVTKVRDGDDFVVPVGIYPQQKDGEAENVVAMMEAIDHPVSVSA